MEKEITITELKVGAELPWSVYDRNGALLLPAGTLINSGQQVDRLLASKARRYIPLPTPIAPNKEKKQAEPVTAVQIVMILLDRMEDAYDLVHDDLDDSFTRRIMQLVFDIQTVCSENADAIMGTMQLLYDAPHGLVHPLHAAILCEVACRRMGQGPLERFPIVAAALTHDIGMYEIQQQLFEQTTPLNSDQQHIIKTHPQRACGLLRKKGVTEKRWLDPVLHHHERLDGSGYPDGLKGEQLSHETKLLAIADCYSAMIRPRAYRGRILPKEALKELFQQRGNTIDSELARLFINVLGIFSPGSLVKLSSGEAAIVTGQTRNISEPKVALIADGDGKRLEKARIIETDEQHLKIKGMLCPLENNHLIEGLGTIWPMMNPISEI